MKEKKKLFKNVVLLFAAIIIFIGISAFTNTTVGAGIMGGTVYSAVSTDSIQAPDSVMATGTKTGISVKWSEVDGATGYRIYRKTSGGSYKSIKMTKSLSYKDTNVKAGVTYTYTVRAYYKNSTGIYWSKLDTSIADKGKTNYPQTPDSVMATGTKTGISVKWDEVKGATGYRIYRKTSGGSYSKIKTTKSLSYKDTNAKAGVTYTYVVRAYYQNSSGRYWSKLDTSIADKGKTNYPQSPEGLKVTQITSGAKLKWYNVTGATGYRIYRKTAGGSYKTIKLTTSRSYTDTTVKDGKTYTYVIKAYYKKGNNKYFSVIDNSLAKKIKIEEPETVEEAVEIIVAEYSSSSMSDFKQVKLIHDYLVTTVDYVITSDNSCHTAEGALLNQEAVCDGYSYAFEAVMEGLGYDCDVVYGYAYSSSGSRESHAWNVIKINGKWYHMDVTWDDPLVNGLVVTDGSNVTYDYFLLDSSTMYEDHTIVSSWNASVPTCSSTDGMEWILNWYLGSLDGPYYIASSINSGVNAALTYTSKQKETIYILFDQSSYSNLSSTFSSFCNSYCSKASSGYGVSSINVAGETTNGYIVIKITVSY